MTTQTLARKDRRALKARASKVYDAPGDEAVDIHEAYLALGRRDLAGATQLAQQLSVTLPGNVHPWLILGMVALDQLEGATAEVFFGRAREIAPKNPDALSGLGKARVLQTDAFGAVDLFEKAIAAGSEDKSMVLLYKDLMCRMKRPVDAARMMTQTAARLRDADLFNSVADLYLDAEKYSEAVDALERVRELDPHSPTGRMARIKVLYFRYDYEALARESAALLGEHPEVDEIISLRMSALRNLGRYDEALALLDADFSHPTYYKRALGVAAHVHLDRGDTRAAGIAFEDAVNLTDEESIWSAKGYGTHCIAEGDYAKGALHYAGRQPQVNRARIPYELSAPANLSGRKRLFLMEEQGIGDQLALLPLARLAPLAEGAELTFIGEARMADVLKGNALGIAFQTAEEHCADPSGVSRDETVFIGDLVRYLENRDPARAFGGYLRPDPDRVATFRQRYREMAGDGPLVGLSWFTRDGLTGSQRSVALRDLVAQLAPGTLAVNLQYGDCTAEIAAASAARPEVTIFDDPEVDQFADLGAFMAQITALDRVITIDNTTAHACGALGHPDAHLLLPTGAECMWYWLRRGTRDPWYGNLALHRQARPRDWARPFAEIAAL